MCFRCECGVASVSGSVRVCLITACPLTRWRRRGCSQHRCVLARVVFGMGYEQGIGKLVLGASGMQWWV